MIFFTIGGWSRYCEKKCEGALPRHAQLPTQGRAVFVRNLLHILFILLEHRVLLSPRKDLRFETGSLHPAHSTTRRMDGELLPKIPLLKQILVLFVLLLVLSRGSLGSSEAIHFFLASSQYYFLPTTALAQRKKLLPKIPLTKRILPCQRSTISNSTRLGASEDCRDGTDKNLWNRAESFSCRGERV